MKTIIPLFTLLGSFCFAAETAPPATEKEDTGDSPVEAKQPAHDTFKRLNQVANDAWQKALGAADLAKRKFALAEKKFAFADESDGADLNVRLFDANGPGPVVADFGGMRSGTQPLVIKSGEADATALGNLQEDLSVMSRIIAKAVEREAGRDGRDSAMGIALSTFPGARRPQSMYLEGYGALFLMNVKFPLLPPPMKEEEKAEKPADSTWEKTKQELYGPRIRQERVYTVNEPPAEYDAEQVDNLKKELLETLKNASNIRGLKPEEFVTIVVMGNRGGASSARVRRSTKGAGATGQNMDMLYTYSDLNREKLHESTLTIRVKKADIDALAKGTIDSEELKKRASVTVY